MKSTNLSERTFDVMLEAACEELLDERITEWGVADTEKHEFSPAFERRMKTLLHMQTRRLRIKKARKALSRVAVAILVVMVAGFTVTLSVEALRVQFFNTVIEFAEEYIGFSFDGSDEQSTVGVLRPTYIPEGYLESDVQIMQFGTSIIYRHDDGGRIIFKQYIKSEGLNIRIDGEHSDAPYFVDINGVDAQVFESNTEGYDSYVIWEIGNNFYMLAGNIHHSELIEMAKSMVE